MAKSTKNKSEEAVAASLDSTEKVVDQTTESVDAVEEKETASLEEVLNAQIEEYQKKNKELTDEVESLKVIVTEKDAIIEELEEDLNKLSEAPEAQQLLTGINPDGRIEDSENGAVYVATNGDCYVLTDQCPERFNFNGVNKSKEEWSRDLDAMIALVKAHSPLVKLLK